MLPICTTHRVATSAARDQLPALIHFVQDPRAACILTRHGKDVAAIVSMAELKRIDKQHDIEAITKHGHRPSIFTVGPHGFWTNAEAAEHIQQLQMDRRIEREVLAKAGLDPVPGGELTEEVAVVREVEADQQVRRRWWWWFW
ncbi:type II toxin-antitoxin system Phd/YefM family antitoxin [uncultured Litoreibacter sp.]|uniref:type II toxin-antitoxin system Phd/YefM family antitoxin n=1 Tax=uncultured Litoreibacter sp. TaxID=1392394 RepID=UPI00263650EF|nr:type II toxin-antitoxin system Phd/YefM family antitoxin [uncultured Litoreibacter sp.]